MDIRGKKLVVIGGAGYIGSHVVAILLDNGYRVRVLDRLVYGRKPLEEFEGHRNLEILEGDVTDIAKLTAAIRGTSVVVHLAGLVGDPACAVDPEFTRHTNIIATRMAKDVANSMGVWRFIFASSCSVYGASDVCVKEGDKLKPVSLYAQTKIDSEEELLLSSKDDFFVTILRFATVFGHSRRPRFDLVANLFTAQAMTSGKLTVIGPEQQRPFVHVHDLARAILMTIRATPESVQNQIFNVGDSRLNMTILGLAKSIESTLSSSEFGIGREIEITVTESPDDPRNYKVSFEKIKRILGFKAETMMEAGVLEMAQHFANTDYDDYRSEIYSNIAMTKKSVDDFYDPIQASTLYAPRNEASRNEAPRNERGATG